MISCMGPCGGVRHRGRIGEELGPPQDRPRNLAATLARAVRVEGVTEEVSRMLVVRYF